MPPCRAEIGVRWNDFVEICVALKKEETGATVTVALPSRTRPQEEEDEDEEDKEEEKRKIG